MGNSNADAERRLWQLDPTMYSARSKPRSKWTRLIGRLKASGRFVATTALMGYPLFLIYMGLVYGMLGFWGTFLLSIIVIGVLIDKAGYGRNFQNAGNGGMLKGLIGLFLAFGITLTLYVGLFMLKSWLLPVSVLILLAGLGSKVLRG